MAHKRNGVRIGPVLMLAVLLMAPVRSESQVLPYPYVPLFQYQVFYKLDLDLSPAGAMAFTGPVFCNSNIWCCPGATLTFDNTVEAGGNYYFHWNTNGDQPANIDADPVEPVFNDEQPVSHALQAIFPSSGPEEYPSVNFESLLNLPPQAQRAPQTIAYDTTNLDYCFNAASLIISNSYWGTNGIQPWSNSFAVYLQDSVQNPFYVRSNGVPMNWIRLTNNYFVVSNRYNGVSSLLTATSVPNFRFTDDVSSIRWTNNPIGTNSVWFAGFSFLTNSTFYDYREQATVRAVQINVGTLDYWIIDNSATGIGALNQELGEDIGHGINSIYVYNAVPFIGQQQLPAVSLIYGQQLPSSTNVASGRVTSGLTVVTPQPLYVIGNYNVQIADGSGPVLGSHDTTNTYPAALMADAITVLSANWPANEGQTSYSARPAASDTVNAACLTGIVPSTGGQTEGGDGPNAHYSGGLENYFRLLENWSGDTLTYNGSMAAMFPSIYATNYWQLPDNYYGIPIRNWAFDQNFLIESDLPPLTPVLVNSNAAPMLLTQPTNAVVLAGQTTNFTVIASGVPAVSYQWCLVGRTNIIGATNASLSLTDIQLANAGNYFVVVTNVFGSVISSNALLSVYSSAAPALTAFSFSQTNSVEFLVSGVPGFNYTVEASTNLIDWLPLMTTNSPFIFTDTNATVSQRFYRGVYLP